MTACASVMARAVQGSPWPSGNGRVLPSPSSSLLPATTVECSLTKLKGCGVWQGNAERRQTSGNTGESRAWSLSSVRQWRPSLVGLCLFPVQSERPLRVGPCLHHGALSRAATQRGPWASTVEGFSAPLDLSTPAHTQSPGDTGQCKRACVHTHFLRKWGPSDLIPLTQQRVGPEQVTAAFPISSHVLATCPHRARATESVTESNPRPTTWEVSAKTPHNLILPVGIVLQASQRRAHGKVGGFPKHCASQTLRLPQRRKDCGALSG